MGRSGILLIGFVAVLGWNVADNKRPNVAYLCPDSIADNSPVHKHGERSSVVVQRTHDLSYK